MKTKFFLFNAVILSSICSNSQNLIARHSGRVITFYKTLTAAYTAIINDDKIYFSGGAFEAPRQFIKKLNIIGAGAKIDGSMATGYTKIFAMGTEVKINTGYQSYRSCFGDSAKPNSPAKNEQGQ